jgi:hypothetical protein
MNAPTNLPPRLVYNGEVIRDRGEMISLTDMWKAAGSLNGRRPDDWKKDGANRAFLDHVALITNAPVEGIWRGRRGNNGGTFAHWQIALAYAKYLSPAFHAWCNEVVRERMEGGARGALPADVAEQIERSFGIARMLAHKVTGLEQTIESLTCHVNGLILAADPRVAALEYASVRQLLDEAKAIQKGRNGINRKIGRELRMRALLQMPPVPVRRCPHSGVWLYPRSFAETYMRERGAVLVREHNDMQAGQGVIRFPDRRTRPDA